MISLAEWQAKGQVFGYKGHPMFYADDGQGEVLLLIHGFPTASWDWTPIWPELTRRFRCIAPDMIGFGFSAKPYDYQYSMVDQADLHENLLKTVGVKSVHILAHDYGDSVAQELLARCNEGRGLDIRSVCFLNGGLFPESHRARLVQKLLNSPLGVLLSRLMSKGSFERSFSAVFGPNTKPSQLELDNFWQLVNREHGTRIAHKLIRYIGERRRNRDRWVSAIQKAEIPIRVINGPADPVSGMHMTERYRELIPDPDIVYLENIGHYPQVEDPQGVLTAFNDFHDRIMLKEGHAK